MEGVQTLETQAQVKVFNLTWNKRYKEAKKESERMDETNFYGNGFSDQMYLIRTADFRAPIYECSHPDAERYPAYGGELFEKRVYAWMRHHNYTRASYKHGSYLHQNFTKTIWKQQLAILIKSPNLFKE